MFSIAGITDGLVPGQLLTVQTKRADGTEFSFQVKCRIDTPIEIEYYRHGGILPYVLRLLLADAVTA
jgi:aconitate hydratase